MSSNQNLRVSWKQWIHKTAYGRISTEFSWGPYCRKGWQFTATLQFCTQIFPMPQAMKIPAAKTAVDKEWEKLEKIPALDLTTVRSKKRGDRWSKDDGRKSSFLPHWWTSVIWRMPNRRQSTKNIKVELYSEATLWKMILDLMQYSQNKDHQHHKWQQQKSWISYPDCQGAQDKQLMQYLLIPRLNGRCSKIIENSQIVMSRHLDSSTTTQMA